MRLYFIVLLYEVIIKNIRYTTASEVPMTVFIYLNFALAAIFLNAAAVLADICLHPKFQIPSLISYRDIEGVRKYKGGAYAP